MASINQKWIFLLVLLQGVILYTNAQGNFTCTEDGFFPVDDQCTGNYINCFNNKPYNETCPPNFVFDPVAISCVKFENASCYFTTTTIRTTTPLNVKCPSSSGFFTVPGKCSHDYILCQGGLPYLQTCPVGPDGETGVFDPQTCNCQPPLNASCFVCPTENGFYAIPAPPGTCNTDYYSCVSGSPYVQTCPSGTVFDPATQLCKNPQLATCSNSTEFRCPTPNGRFPNTPGEQCNNTYYQCIENVAYRQTCPGTAVFDPTELVCIAKEEAGCPANDEKATSQCYIPSNKKRDGSSFPSNPYSETFYEWVSQIFQPVE